YGETAELLPKYGWYCQNAGERTWPVGSKKPNDLGLFDMHGNMYTWCQESFHVYQREKEGEAIEDKEDDLKIDGATPRVVRGGAFDDLASQLRCGNRAANTPGGGGNRGVGFRPARTFR